MSLEILHYLKVLKNMVKRLEELVYAHGNRHKLGGGDALFPFDYDIYPAFDNQFDIGRSDKRVRNIYAVNVVTGDLVFGNGWRIVEDGEYGLVIVSPDGKRFKVSLTPIE